LIPQAWFEYKTMPSFPKSIFDRALEHLSPVKPRHAPDISPATLSTGPSQPASTAGNTTITHPHYLPAWHGMARKITLDQGIARRIENTRTPTRVTRKAPMAEKESQERRTAITAKERKSGKGSKDQARSH
jgi:hypothetical protein